ncbi:hypothetical protein jhhlp_008784 [Lomentospora prolificans]|uniref:CBM1 domain-containing protein n=1 Tax=Lomentospora prolificans TaxID=41688 RepID=A0A2N3MZ04_9PEZI|nr:hypothetical protein jhhlp_008784 [Lomentospora prolificans]
MYLRSSISLSLLTSFVAAQTQTPWGQCGGNGWSGATACGSGYTCTHLNEWYYQCVPGAAPTTPATSSTSRTSAVVTTPTGGVTSSSRTTLQTSTKTGSGSSAGPTLVSGWYWIRAVAEPNYHKYLQSKPAGSPSAAYLDDGSNAGQFNVVDGQLVFNTGSTPLYMHVENPTDKTQRVLETWFDEAPNDYGTFAFQGDTLTWHVSDIKRQNEAAWYVCENQKVFINTGAYLYQTPEGCADQTIHSYGGATADL